jgi:hypothetical protein
VTREECAAVLGYLSAAFPQVTVAPQTVAVWADQVGGQEGVDAHAAARRVVRSNKWFPSIAEFLEACRLERELRSQKFEVAGELPSAETKANRAEVARRFVALSKELLESQKGKVHWHGGPDPCLVCGGMKS